MKTVTTILKIVAIAFNTIFLTFGLILIARWGPYTESILAWTLTILFFICPPITLIAIVLTFLKKVKILTNVLKVFAIILNFFFLIFSCRIWVAEQISFGELDVITQVFLLLLFLITPINILTISLTFRRESNLIQTSPITAEKKRVSICGLILKIVAMALNTIFLTIWLISLAKSEISGIEGVLQWALMILFFTSLPVSLIAIVFTFLKKIKILTNVLKVLAIISNVFVLIYYCGLVVTFLEWYVLFWCIFPVINILAIALPFRRKSEPIEGRPKSTMNIVALILKIIAIDFNIILLTILLISVARSEISGPDGFLQWALLILSFLIPVINILTIAFTFRREGKLIETRPITEEKSRVKILSLILKIIAIALNTIFLTIWLVVVARARVEIYIEGFLQWTLILSFLFLVINILAIALPFRRKSNLIEGRPTIETNGVNIDSFTLKIIAIALNTIFLTIWLNFLAGVVIHIEGFLQWAITILSFTSPPVTLITIVFTFLKKIKILTNVLKVLAVILNFFFLTFSCCSLVANISSLGEANFLVQILILLIFLITPINILTIALTFRRKVKLIETGPKVEEKRPLNIATFILKLMVIFAYAFVLVVILVIAGKSARYPFLVWACGILMVTGIPITLITILCTYLKGTKPFITALKIISITLNVPLLICIVALAVMPKSENDLPRVTSTSRDKPVDAKRREIKPIESIIPEKNLEIPEGMQNCAAKLKRIYAGIKQYEKDKGTLPNWLSDMVPDYVGAETLFCPNDAEHKASYYPDPKLPCSYIYEFSQTNMSDGRTCRTRKMQEAILFGDVVPIVRCMHHGQETIINVSFGGRIYWSQFVWEQMFMPNYQFGDEVTTVIVNVVNSNGTVSTIMLKKQGIGYVGPRGEYYNTLPTSEQLKPIYGF